MRDLELEELPQVHGGGNGCGKLSKAARKAAEKAAKQLKRELVKGGGGADGSTCI